MKRFALILGAFAVCALVGTSLADACHRHKRGRNASVDAQVSFQVVQPAPVQATAPPVVVQVQAAGGCQGRQGSAGAGCSGAQAQYGAGCAGGRGGLLGLRGGHAFLGFRNR